MGTRPPGTAVVGGVPDEALGGRLDGPDVAESAADGRPRDGATDPTGSDAIGVGDGPHAADGPDAADTGDESAAREEPGASDVDAPRADASGGRAAPPRPRPVRRSPPPADESFLVRAAQRGDLDAFGELLRRHEQPAFRVALRMLGSSSEAEDATQDAFLQAWRALPRFRGGSSFGTWLYRITTNRCLNVIAARRPVDALDESREGDHRGDPVALAQQNEEMGALTASIGRLPAEQRAALVLREFEGLSYDEIAEVLQITLAAVKGRIHRARAQIALDLAGFR